VGSAAGLAARALSRIGLPQLFIGAIVLVAMILATGAVSDPDFFWHLRVGQWIIDHHSIPTHDLFTYTVSDHRFVAHEWLKRGDPGGHHRRPRPRRR